MLVLSVLWFAWAAYAWLTSVIDPEEGAVRLVMFAAMFAIAIANVIALTVERYERKLAEEALRESEQRLAEFQNAPAQTSIRFRCVRPFFGVVRLPQRNRA